MKPKKGSTASTIPLLQHIQLAIYTMLYVHFESAVKNIEFLQSERKMRRSKKHGKFFKNIQLLDYIVDPGFRFPDLWRRF